MMHPMDPGMGYPLPPAPTPDKAAVIPAPQPVAENQALPTDKDQLGEQLYALVEKKNPENAAKITGMLLEMEVDQIHSILTIPAQLDKWVAEAIKVLNSAT